MSQKYRAPVVRKAFSILDLLARSEGALSLSDLSRALQIGKSTVLGIVEALEDAGAVRRDHKTRRYRLGLGLLELGRAASSRMDLKDVARPFMETLMEEIGESVFLGVERGDHVTILEVVESAKELKITAPVGTRIPLLVGATGKVFLAALSEARARELVSGREIRRHTGKTITNPERLLEEVRRARRDGFALDDEEYIQGARAVAAPIAHGSGGPSAIWVVGFTPSMTDEKLRRVAEMTRRTAEAIGRELREHNP